MKMTPSDRQEANDDRGYQEQLVHSLLDCLSRVGAVHACQANAWDSVPDVLLPRDRDA